MKKILKSFERRRRKPYTHSVLRAPNSVRLLKLHPARSHDDTLCCSLDEINSENLPEVNYEALSYACGSQHNPVRVHISDGFLLITQNCAAALRHIRSSDQARMLWVDSICISQNSNTERSSQIQQMHRIYRHADRTLIWLGMPGEKDETVVKLLDGIASLEPDDREDEYQETMRELLTTFTRVRRNTGHDYLTTFFDNSWFHRLWTVQESVLANREESTMICGNSQITWSRFGTAAGRLKAIGFDEGNIQAATNFQATLGARLLIRRLALLSGTVEEAFRSQGYTTTTYVTDLFQDGQEKQATDPKDKVFALYGLLQELEVHAHFEDPDYNKPLARIYAETVKACILQDKNTWILLSAPQVVRRRDIPSWVPDWSTPRGYMLQNDLTGLYKTDFNASLNSINWVSFRDGWRYLGLRGRVVDTVVKLLGNRLDDKSRRYYANAGWTKYAQTEIETEAKTQLVRQQFTDLQAYITAIEDHGWDLSEHSNVGMFKAVLDAGATGSSLEEMWPLHPERTSATVMKLVLQTILSGDESISDNVTDQLLQLDIENQTLILEALRKGIEFPMTDETKRFLSQRDPRQTADFFCAVTRSQMRNRDIFLTENGRIGSALEMVQSGDLVVLAAGVKVPLILRRSGARYRLVSNAYIHGIMKGEAWPPGASDYVSATKAEPCEVNPYGIEEISLE